MGTDFRSMYDRDYIGHFDLPGGKDLTLTIKRVIGGELTAMGGRKSKKPIVHFKETDVKPLICNKTNGKTIAAMYGNEVEAWAGKRITLFVSSTRNPDGGGDVNCIRVRPKIPNGRFEEPGEEPRAAAAPELLQKIKDGLMLAPEPLRKRFDEKLAAMDATLDTLSAEDAEGALKWLNAQLDKLPATQI